MTKNKTKEQQYESLFDLKKSKGLQKLGVMNNQVWNDDPKRLVFTLARYKFVAKILSGKKNALEIGCGDAFASRIVQQEVENLTVTDFDPLFIEDIKERYDDDWRFKFCVHNMLSGPMSEQFDAFYALDVLEHIRAEDEHSFLSNAVTSLSAEGIAIIGMPSLESQAFASPQSREGHVNCKTGSELKTCLSRYFNNVFIFSMNDEVVHTGFHGMAHYLLALCTNPVRR